MTIRFVSTRYPQLWIPALRVRFQDGQAEVTDLDVAARLASWPTPGVSLADGESLPEPEDDDDGGQDPGDVPQRPAKAAPVDAWREYVLATYDVDADEVADMTKAQLQELAATE